MCEHDGHAQPPLRQDPRPRDSARARSCRRPARSASTSRCGSWSLGARARRPHPAGRHRGGPRHRAVRRHPGRSTAPACCRRCRPTSTSSSPYLEQHPRELPDLHCVRPHRGAFLKKELVQRWFATQPGIPLVNTYGLTETSYYAVHEIMHAVPEQDRVPLGRPIINVAGSTSSTRPGTPVPLGAPGLIVFSGVCVGPRLRQRPRAHRPRSSSGPIPHRPGERRPRNWATPAAGCPTGSWTSSAAATTR